MPGSDDARARGPSAAGAPPADITVIAPPAEPSGGYDLLPYPSMPIALTQPAHLAALAILFGIPAPTVSRARVLELGCASGGNIIPLAARFPEAHFSGIDLSARHIDDGRTRVAALGLDNVQLDQGDLARLTLASPALQGAPFDYVICHGVFSWVPRAAQDAILRICRDTLAPDGIAAISYNVLPGWHLRMVVRDLCLAYAGGEDAGGEGGPHRRVARARAALEQIAEASPEGEPYGLLLRTEARRLRPMPAAYILGEFLAPHNAPCTVRDFIGRAGQYGLDYLCEADLSAAAPQSGDPATRDAVPSPGGADRVAIEQHIDFLTGRPFRCSVLVRHPAAREPCLPSPQRLRSLHLASSLRLDTQQEPAGEPDRRGEGHEQPAVFRDERARAITTRDPAVHQALARLAAAFPSTLTIDALVADPAVDPQARAGIEERVCDALFAMVLAGQASVSALPLGVGRAAEVRPTAWRVARLEAASPQPWVTSLRHMGVPALPLLRVLLPHLDGAHDRAALAARLLVALRSGAVQLPELPAGQSLPALDRLTSIAGLYVEQLLHYCARHALLVP